jgi:hypothetical protein
VAEIVDANVPCNPSDRKSEVVIPVDRLGVKSPAFTIDEHVFAYDRPLAAITKNSPKGIRDGRGGVGRRQRAVQIELHPGHPDIVRGGRRSIQLLRITPPNQLCSK